ncbi:hypothetical protein AGMMS50233_06500 [Endomicrobiia bacterium]|nr:hypothetical protein AGMMS50233_06500 [Endomicrobiia bacterium]
MLPLYTYLVCHGLPPALVHSPLYSSSIAFWLVFGQSAPPASKEYLLKSSDRNAPAGTLHIRNILREIYRTAQEIHAELGPGYRRKRYAGALAARYSGQRYGCEQDVILPCIAGMPQYGPPEDPAEFIKADFTFLNRKVLVRVVLYQWEITPGVCRDLWWRMNVTGVPLGLILNFGRPEFKYKRVVHHKYLQQWQEERQACRFREGPPLALLA